MICGQIFDRYDVILGLAYFAFVSVPIIPDNINEVYLQNLNGLFIMQQNFKFI